MKNLITLSLFFLASTILLGQGSFTINSNVDTTNSNIREVIEFYKLYYTSDAGGVKREELWNFKGKKGEVYDIAYQHIVFPHKKEKFLSKYSIQILEVNKLSNKYVVKAAGVLKDNSQIKYIHSINIVKNKNGFHFENCFDDLVSSWNLTSTPSIDVYRPKNSPYLSYDLDTVSQFCDSLVRFLEIDNKVLKPKPKYFIANSKAHFMNLLGFEFYANNYTSGTTDRTKKIIVTAKGPFHAHEIVHLYSNKRMHYILEEGFATYFGTAKGRKNTYENYMNILVGKVISSGQRTIFMENLVNWKNVELPSFYKNFVGAMIFEYLENKYGKEMVLKLVQLNTISEYSILEGLSNVTNNRKKKILKELVGYMSRRKPNLP